MFPSISYRNGHRVSRHFAPIRRRLAALRSIILEGIQFVSGNKYEHSVRPTRRRLVIEGLELRAVMAAAPLGDLANIGPDLNAVIHEYEASQQPIVPTKDGQALPYQSIYSDRFEFRGDEIYVEARGHGDISAWINDLSSLGFDIFASVPSAGLVEGFLPIHRIDEVAKALGTISVLPIWYVETTDSVGSVSNAAETTLKADVGARLFGVDGTGVTVGVISDSANQVAGGIAASQGTGDLGLGALTQVLIDSPGGSDEGRAMMELIHDIAPGAPLRFASGDGGEAAFANAVNTLVGAGSNIIVDDLNLLTVEPFFYDGIASQSVTNAVVNNGVTYFASAGNRGNGGFEMPYSLVNTTVPFMFGTQLFHDFDSSGGTDAMQTVTLQPGTTTFVFQWDQFWGSVATDLDFYVTDATGTTILAAGVAANIATQVAREIVSVNVAVTTTVQIAIHNFAGPAPTRFKYIGFNSPSIGEHTTSTGALVNPTNPGHSSNSNAISIAAANVGTPTTVASYSSRGPATRTMTPTGTAIPLQILNKPDFTSNDGAQTSVPGFQPFFGTSAAAPNAAAVAALLLDYNPSLTPAQIRTALLNGAIDIGAAGYDFASGNGLIDATSSLLSLSGGVLTIDGDVGATDDDIVVKQNATDSTLLDIKINGTSLTPIKRTLINSIQVNGKTGTDKLTIDLSNGNFIPAGGISYAGGESAGDNDVMEVKGYNVSTLTVNHTGVESGNIQLGGKSINFSEIEPLALAGTAADLVINLPAGPNTDVVIADDTNANFPGLGLSLANTSAIDASSFEYTSFTNPTNSLQVNFGSNGDTATLRMMDASFAPAGAAVAAPFMVTGGNGVDVVNVQATTVRTIVNVGLGADTINVSSNAPLNTGTLDDLNAILVAISGDSNLGDRQNISQSGNAAGDTVQVDGNASFVTYSGTAGGGWRVDVPTFVFRGGTHISTGSGVDTFNVVSTFNSEPVTINAGGGDDVFNVSSNAPTNTGNLASLNGPLTLDGQGGSNKLTVSNSGFGGSDNVTITDSSITGTAAGGYNITYAATSGGTFGKGIQFDGSSGGNTINVTNTLAGAPTTVNSGNGVDTINVTAVEVSGPLTINAGSGLDNINIGNTGVVGTPGKLTPIAGLVTVDGGVGGAKLTVDGSGVAVNADYTVTNSHVTRPIPAGFGGVNYSNLNSLLLTVGSGTNNVLVPNTSVPTTINTNDGADVITIGNGTLDAISAAVTVSGGLGTPDKLVIDDSADVSSNTYSVDPTSVSRSGGPTITYDGTVEALTVKGGTNADSYTVSPSPNTSIEVVDSTTTSIEINLPTGPTSATLADSLPAGDNKTEFTGMTIQPVIFPNPTSQLTINRGNALDSIAINSIPDLTSSVTVGSSLNPLNSVSVAGTVGLAGGNLNISANTLNVSSTSVSTGGGNIVFNGDSTFVVGSAINAGAGTFTNNGALNGNGSIVTNGGITINNTDSGSTFAGVMSGNGSLIKNGVGSLSLTGANVYTGTTTVNNGKLLVNGSIGTLAFPSHTTVNSPGLLGGAGVINGNVNGNGSFAPGNSPGILTINGNFSPTGSVSIEVNSPGLVAGTHYDQFNVNGTVTLNNSTLNTSGTVVSAANWTLVIINNDGTDTVSGTFNGLPEGSTVNIGGVNFKISYVGGTNNNDVVLTSSPQLPPNLINPGNQTTPNGATNVVLNLIATDPNNDPLTYSAMVMSIEAVIDQQLGLSPADLNMFFNWGGLREKWFTGTTYPWYYMTPDGNLYAWRGGSILGNDVLIQQFSVDVYNNPQLLFNPSNVPPASVSLVGNILTINPNDDFVGKFAVIAKVDDGFGGTDSEQFFVTVTGVSPDMTAPTITNRSPAPASTLTGSTMNLDVTFSEPVVGVDATDLVLTGSSSVGAIKGTPINVSGNLWRFPVSGLVNGTLNVSLAPDANDIEDAAGNDLALSSWSYSVSLSLAPLPPVLNPIPNQVLANGQINAVVNLVAIDPNNDPLTFTASAESLERYLDQTLDLRKASNEFLNWGGLNEKWMLGNGGWYYILPNGKLYQWLGGSVYNATLIDQVTPTAYVNPALLYDAAVNNANATLSVVGNVLTVDPQDSFVGKIFVTARVSDGNGGSDMKSFFVSVGPGGAASTIPSITNISPAPGSTLSTSAAFIDITFSEPVVRVDATDMVLGGGASLQALVGLPTPLSANTWRFSLSKLSNGPLTVVLAPDPHDIQDLDDVDLGSVSWSYMVSL